MANRHPRNGSTAQEKMGGPTGKEKNGLSFSALLAEADGVRDEVHVSQSALRAAAAHTPVAGSIQSALAALMQPVPWVGLRLREGRLRRLNKGEKNRQSQEVTAPIN